MRLLRGVGEGGAVVGVADPVIEEGVKPGLDGGIEDEGGTR